MHMKRSTVQELVQGAGGLMHHIAVRGHEVARDG